MDSQTKQLLKHSLRDYRASTTDERKEKASHVQRQLESHERALNIIGTGYSDHYVQAGRIFLRIIKQN